MFDIASDPPETNNLLLHQASGEGRESFKRIESVLDSRIADFNSTIDNPVKPSASALSTIQHKLKSLGYLQ